METAMVTRSASRSLRRVRSQGRDAHIRSYCFGKNPAHELIIGGDFNEVGDGVPLEIGSITWFKVESRVVHIHIHLHQGPFPST